MSCVSLGIQKLFNNIPACMYPCTHIYRSMQVCACMCACLLSSSLGDLPCGRSNCPTTPLFSMLCLFLEFPVSVLHHPVHELLSRLSSSSLPFHPSFHY